MQKESVADVLRSLARGDQNRSETARLRDVFPDVEAALQAGVSRAAVLEALHGQGFKMNLKSFESALYRIRRQKAKTAEPGAPFTQDTPPPPTAHQPVAPVAAAGGKLRSEQVLDTPTKSFSFKKLQQEKDQTK
ncbi:hypothetical protein P245_03260 [Comamonas thiooxydans]|uniref:Uncharacterized protein n=1 Tax=Comamonas thiooxydans TaxID=363952 RepID=A0A0E3BKG3_9BURK|nr:hypothetical protein [Comamonas thiooxydans]KGH00004.1 hypothetical protein P245_03260 [Comamonas thiooxydans]